MEHRLHLTLQIHGCRRLRDPITNSRHTENSDLWGSKTRKQLLACGFSVLVMQRFHTR
jgi:hypothetical protein